jgi:hypothetical protein
MSILLALRRGMRALNRAKRLWFIFYAALTLAAVLPAAAFLAIAFQSLGHSTWAAQLGRSFDLEWIGELLAQYGGMPADPVLPVLAGIFLISAIIHLFLLGGAIEMFARRQWFSAASFFRGCGRNFWRLFRLALYSLILLAAALGVRAGLAAIGRKLWGEGSVAAPLIYWSWFYTAVTLLLLGVVHLIFDYAAIRLVAQDSRQAWRGLWRACRFVWRHFGPVARLVAALWIILLALTAIYFGISKLFVQTSVAAVLVLLIVRQAAVLARIWSRLLFYSSQCEMYDALAPPPPAAAPSSE